MARKIERDEDPTLVKAREFIALSKMIDDLSKKRDALKSALSDVLDSTGESDESGHRYLQFPEPIDGVRGFKRERRVSNKLDPSAANKILVETGLMDRCTRVVAEVDQDEVMACVASGELDAESVEKMYPGTVSWAFKTLK